MQSTSSEPAPWKPDLFGKQWDVFNCRKRILLVSGSRISGKTHSALQRLVRHLWETKNARVGFFSKSQKLAKDGGPWQELLEKVLPEWIEAGIGLEFATFDGDGVPGPKTDAQTRTAYFRIRNYYGGTSECKLFSIDHDHEVESKVKSKAFSMIFFSELSMFKDRRVLLACLPSLRHISIPRGEKDIWQMFMADTNPDVDEGNRSWFYQMFYKERMEHSDNPDVARFRNNLEVIEMFLKENPYATDDQISDLIGGCAGDQAMYDSYVLGIHGDGGRKRNRLFSSFFSRPIHVMGTEGDPTKDQIRPRDNSTTLYGGWDLGAVNHGSGIMDKWYRMKDGKEQLCWSILDEHVSIKELVSLESYVADFMAKVKAIEDRAKRTFEWTHWSDDSSINVWRPGIGTYDYLEIQKFSRGKIMLQGVTKPKGSINARIRMLRKYLQEERLFVSARCVNVIEMLEQAQRGDDESEPILRNQFSHTFDWLTYVLYSEEISEMLEISESPTTEEDLAAYASIP